MFFRFVKTLIYQSIDITASAGYAIQMVLFSVLVTCDLPVQMNKLPMQGLPVSLYTSSLRFAVTVLNTGKKRLKYP